MKKINHKTVLITGHTGGVGLAIAELFLNNKWNVWGLNREGLFNLRSISGKQPQWNKRVYAHATYYSRMQYISEAFNDENAKISLFINNAAIFKRKPFNDFTCDQIYDIIYTNLIFPMYLTKEVIRRMRKDSRIINIGSVAGLRGIKNQAVYCASKFGLNGFFEALQPELQKRGILCTTINPGGIDTPLWNKTNPYPGDTAKLLKPSDIASLVWYVANLPANVVFKNATIYPSNEQH